MIKLIVVDDEQIIREGIASMKWEKIGVTCVSSAGDGMNAMDKIKEHKPDIVISDIRMPGYDGMWLIEQIHNLMPKTRIVLLSGYNEFEYAQKAIKYRVSEYVLKPVRPDKLTAVVEKIKLEIERERENEMRLESYREYLLSSRCFLKSWFLNCIETGKTKKISDIFGIDCENGGFCALTVKFEDISGDDDDFNMFAIYSELEMVAKAKCEKEYASFFNGDTITYVFPLPKEGINMIFDIAGALKSYLDYNYSGVYTIGIGSEAKNASGIPLSVKGSENACEYRFYIGDRQIIFISDIEPLKSTGSRHTKEYEQYSIAIKNGSEEMLKEILDKLFKSMIADVESVDIVKRVCLELLVRTTTATYELGMNPDMLFKNTDIWSVINKCNTIRGLHELLLNVNRVLISEVMGRKEKINKSITQQAVKIIEEQYCLGISLEKVAEQVYLSPNYLSMVFSKDMGMTFKDYLISVRIKKSMELLKDRNLKIYQVAEMVGYADWRYFSEVFKKYTGLTPAAYRAEN